MIEPYTNIKIDYPDGSALWVKGNLKELKEGDPCVLHNVIYHDYCGSLCRNHRHHTCSCYCPSSYMCAMNYIEVVK